LKPDLEFIRRVLLHVLPSGLVRIRQFRLSGQPLPHSQPATVPRFARCSPNSRASQLPRPCRCQRSRLLILSDLQARAVDQDRIPPPRTGYGPRHFMTQSRGFSSSSFSIPPWVSADPGLHAATLRVPVCSPASPAILIVARIPSHDSNCAVSGILRGGFRSIPSRLATVQFNEFYRQCSRRRYSCPRRSVA